MNDFKNIQIKSIKTGFRPSGLSSPHRKKNNNCPGKKRRKLTLFGFILLTIILAFIAGGVGSVMTNKVIFPYLSTIPFLTRYSFFQSGEPIVVEKKEKVTVTEESAVIEAVKKISPTTVSIIASRDVIGFFGDIFQQKAGGTGLILTNDGLIATNKHVVADAKAEYTVVTQDGKNYQARVIARDPSNDFAIIKIPAENLPVVELGSSAQLQVGQKVIAIGNTLGEYQNTVTTGVVSAIGRSISAGDGLFQSENLENVIQTDAAINPGNSGGPLVNIRGQVIGINTAIDRGGQLIGFAIPIDTVKPVIESVISEGKIIRPFIGIRYIPITLDFATLNKLPVEKGALVYTGDPDLLPVLPGGPAQKAGIRELDIITKVNDEEIDETHSLTRLIQKYKPGEEITLTILRGKETLEIKLVLGEMEEE